jgi:transcriptional regulator with XRE-family HTH domain
MSNVPALGRFLLIAFVLRVVSHGGSLAVAAKEGPEPNRPARRQPGADAPHDACDEPGKLGDALGLTFQQVQKYEKGTNRIGASRLQQISHILQVPVAFFFEGAPDASVPRRSHGGALSIAQIDDLVSDSNGLRLIEAFMRINNAALRRKIVRLVQEIAGDDDDYNA